MSFFRNLRRFVHPGDTVAELYHGEKSDILRWLSEIVGDKGKVYGIDELNPFPRDQNMVELSEIPNIKLVKARIPPMPAEIPALDAIVVREFIWTYPRPYDGRTDPEVYRSINNALKEGGHLLIHLNQTEIEYRYAVRYTHTIDRFLKYKQVYNFEDLLAFKK